MPVYEYQGLHYDLSETDPTAAKTKIMAHLGKSTSTDSPAMQQLEAVQPSVKPKMEEQPTAGEKFLGGLEATATTVTGFASGIVEQAVSGIAALEPANIGTKAGAQRAQEEGEQVSKALTYEPKTKAGKAMVQGIQEMTPRELQAVPFLGPEITALSSVVATRYGSKLAKASPEDKAKIVEEITKDHPEYTKEEVNNFINAPEDRHINAKAVASKLVTKNADKATVSRAIEKNPLVEHYLEEYQAKYDALKEAMGKGEVTPQPKTFEDLKEGKPNFIQQEPDKSSFIPREQAIAEGQKVGIAPEDAEAAAKPTEKSSDSLIKQVDDIVRTRINNILGSERIIKNNAESINERVPNKTIREHISEIIDKGGAYFDTHFAKLSKEEQAATNDVRRHFAEIGERAQKLGIFEALRENYISHIVDWSKVAPSEVDRLKEMLLGDVAGKENVSSTSRFGKGRKYETFEDLQNALKGKGLDLVTKDVSEIYSIYAKSMERAIENKKMIDALRKVQAEDENGIQWALQKITDKNPIPRGWDIINHAQMRGYAVNPDLAPAMKFVFEGKDPSALMKGALAVTQATKRLNVIGSFFHAKSLVEAMYGNTGVFSTLSELGKMGYDAFAKTQHAAINKALEQYRKGGLGDSTDKWLRAGLVVATPEDVTVGVLGQIGKAADEVLAKVGPKTQIGEKVMGATEKATLGVFDQLTWNYLHTGLKLSVAEKMLEKAKLAHPDIPEAQHRLEISRHINNSFGSLNHFDVATQSTTKLGREIMMNVMSPEGRRVQQLLMFAPDWTHSTIRAFTTALPKTINPLKWDIKGGAKGLMNPATQADYARRYQLRTAFIYATAINGMNMMTSGHPLWENKDPTRLEFEDGTSMQLMKHAAEPYHWMADPDKTMANKLGFIPRSMMIGLGGLQYASPTAPKLKDNTMIGRAKAIAQSMLPFQAQAAIQAPEGQGTKRALFGTAGLPVYGMSKDEKKEALAAARRKKKEEE